MMPDKDKIKLFYGVSLAFIALNVVFIANEVYWFMALPAAVLILMMFFFSLDKLLWGIVLLTPLSFPLKDDALGFSIILPTEPIVAAVMGLFFLKLFYERRYNSAVLKHPVTILILLGLAWMFLTAVTSEIKLVSFKAFLSRLWYVVVFYFVLIQLFRKKEKIPLFPWLYASTLVIIIIAITIEHSTFDFDRKVGTWVVDPFFNDHTHYSAVISFIAPLFMIMIFFKEYSPLRRQIAFLFFVIFIVGIILSYSRASWVSLIAGIAALTVLLLKINYKLIIAVVIVVGGTLFLFHESIIMNLERNRQESSGDFKEHAQSITNISSDASNLERINRWRAAYRMFHERPLLGWGPGTYQLVYAPFQLSQDHTIITTNFGDLGNAHSEYLGPLAESGLPGMLLFIALGISIIFLGVKNYKRASTRELRLISLGITTGFITYLTHGFLNNFLDTDKASVLFWGFLAILVAIDIYHSDSKNTID